MFVEGFSIDARYQPLIHAAMRSRLEVGERRLVKLLLEGKLYDVKILNQYFDREKHAEHKEELMRFEYSEKSGFATRLREIFPDIYFDMHAEYLLPKEQRRRVITLPKGRNDCIVLSATTLPDVFAVDCYHDTEFATLQEEVGKLDEEQYEMLSFSPRKDETAGLVAKTVVQKYRKLDASIGNTLKKLYDYRCQMTGEKVGEEQGGCVAEVHHIKYFTRSLNNDSSNIIILSPNYHRIIHKNNPKFHRKTLTFEFPNGLIEKVKLDKHLKM